MGVEKFMCCATECLHQSSMGKRTIDMNKIGGEGGYYCVVCLETYGSSRQRERDMVLLQYGIEWDV